MNAGSARSVTARVLLSGLVLGPAGLLLFGAVHAVAIVPIWSRLAGGLPFATTAGVAVSWAFYEHWRTSRRPLGVGAGLRFGALAWLAALPATALANAMRLSTAARPLPAWVDAVALGLAAT